MTTSITKERLTKILIETMALIKERSSRAGNSSGISTEVNAELFAKVTRIALAAMDSKPVYQWRERHDEEALWDDCTKEQYDGFKKHPECEARIIYTAPPAPVDNTFIPKNLDRALGVVGVALPESKEEFNFQIERWIQRLIDRVIRYADEFKEQPEPVLPKANPCLKAMMQALDAFYAEGVPERGMLLAFRILLDDYQARTQQEARND